LLENERPVNNSIKIELKKRKGEMFLFLNYIKKLISSLKEDFKTTLLKP